MPDQRTSPPKCTKRAQRMQHPNRSPPPEFTPMQVRGRADGWTPDVQCAFLAALYCTGSVAGAARHVGRSRASAYTLRKRAGAQSFAGAWDHILAGPASIEDLQSGKLPMRRRQSRDWRKLTLKDLIWRHRIGLWRPVIYRGKLRAIARKPDNSALLRLLKRLDARTNRAEDGTA